MRHWLMLYCFEVVHLKEVAKVAMWALKRAVHVEPETSHVVIRIPCESTRYQLVPPRKVDRTWVLGTAG